MAYTGGASKESGWAMFLLLLGFTILGTAATGGGAVSFFVGAALICLSFWIFFKIRLKEEE